MQFENINFKTQKDLETCGNAWANILGLGDWSISYVLCDKESAELELGHNDYDFETKTSVITIYKMPATFSLNCKNAWVNSQAFFQFAQ